MNGFLLDLDGTLYVGDSPIPGAVEAISRLAALGVPRRYLTNTTRLSRQGIAERLQRMGFPIEVDEIFTAPLAASLWLQTNGIERIALYLPAEARADLAGFQVVESGAQAIVVGDLGDDWSFARLNAAFLELMGGARLVALQKNRYWKSPRGIALDAGPFVAALEYAAGQAAIVVGKPSAAFFLLAAGSLGLKPEEITVVGDDVETDVAGAQAAGMRGVLVRTGKFREDVLEQTGIRPDDVADSLHDLVTRTFAP